MPELFEADPPTPYDPFLLGGGGAVTHSYGDSGEEEEETELPPVDVYPPWEFPSTPPYSPPGGGGNGDGGGTGGGGSGGQTPTPDPARPYDACEDRTADDLAEMKG